MYKSWEVCIVPPVTFRVPSIRLTALPASDSVPVPALGRPMPVVATGMDPTVSVPAVTVIVRVPVPPSVTAPLPRLKSELPVKVKSPPTVTKLLVAKATAIVLVLSIVQPLMTNVPVPMAEAAGVAVPPLLMFSVPAFSVVPPT